MIDVAIKILKPGVTSQTKEFPQEAALMKKLQHQNLIQLYGVCAKEEPILIITELMSHGSLLEYLRGDGRSLHLPELIDAAGQVASGMVYLEESKYIHRDLAASNILVGEGMICKVGDFGLARFINEGFYKAIPTAKLPIKWMAPEAALFKIFTMKSDVWSFGIVLYEIITHGETPYPGMTNVEVIGKLRSHNNHMSRPSNCPEEVYTIMTECWKEVPQLRPSFKTVQSQLAQPLTRHNSGGMNIHKHSPHRLDKVCSNS